MTFPVAHAAYVQLLRGYAEITSLAFVCEAVEAALQARWRPTDASRPSERTGRIPVQKQGKHREPRLPANVAAPAWTEKRRRGHGRSGRNRRQRAAGALPETAAALPTSALHAPLHEPRPRRPLFAARQDAVQLLAPPC